MSNPSTQPIENAGYMSGFGNGFETEALPGALPVGRNSPQRCAYGLYAEQLSGSPFTAPRASNERSWLYRIRPTVQHGGRFQKVDMGLWRTAPCHEIDMPIGPLRWSPTPMPSGKMTFLQGIHTMATCGDAASQSGMAAHVYLVTASMVDEYFYSADSELLVVPQEGCLRFCTELGIIDLEPKEIAILPRGLVYRVEVLEGSVSERIERRKMLERPDIRSGALGLEAFAGGRAAKHRITDRNVVTDPLRPLADRTDARTSGDVRYCRGRGRNRLTAKRVRQPPSRLSLRPTIVGGCG